MARIVVFIDHDIMVRHFVANGVLPSLESEHDVVFVFPEKHRRVASDIAALPIRRRRTVVVSDERAHLYRRLYVATVLRRMRKSPDKKPLFRLWREVLGRESFWECWWHSWPPTYGRYRRRALARIGENAPLNALLAEERPDVIIHPTVLEGLFVSDLVSWGRAHGVPTVFLMNSWDNPAVKAMMVGAPSRLAVWGEHSRLLAHERLEVPLEQIVVFGAAQFEPYRRPPREKPADYRRRLGVPDGHRLLLYAGSSKGLNETRHLMRLEEAVRTGVLARTTVLYRPHPWRGKVAGEEDFFSHSFEHIRMAPDMADYYRRSREGQAGIYFADYEETHVTLSAVDAVVSPLSTILLEAALHGKPVTAYLPHEDMKTNVALFSMARTVHFREFFERVDCGQCHRIEDLARDCARLLELAGRPENDARLRRQGEYFAATPQRSYSEQLEDLVQELLRTARTPGSPA